MPTDPTDPLDTTDHSPQERTQATGDFGPADRPAVPATIAVAGYEIECVLGRGGMGVVYKARHLALKRTVALKMILGGSHAGERALARFRIEAEAVARLQHPNIVQIHEIGATDGVPFCALEYIDGGTLAARLAGTPLSPAEAAKLVETLARAMQLAHSRNVVHRDLKPANVLLASDGTPKITDFGLARQTDSDSGATQVGAILGTPSYMAPEQASGRTHDAGPAADVYALGAILYECLTGRPPFQGHSTVETLERVRLQEPLPPAQIHKGVPLDLETICLKCLRKEPEQRYASAAELADELRRYRNGEPILARPMGRVERGLRWCRRNPTLALLSAALVTALLAGLLASTYFARQAAGEAADARAAQQAADQNAARACANERLAYDRAYNSDLRLFQQAWEKNQYDFAHELLDRQRPEQTDGVERRGFEWDYWYRQSHLRVQTFSDHLGPVSCVAFSPDGTLLAAGGQGDYAARTWSVKLWDTRSGRVLHSLSGSGRRATGVAFSPDGKHLVTASDELVARVWEVATGRQQFALAGHTQYLGSVAYSADGRHIATGGGDCTVRLWDAPTGKERLVLKEATQAQISCLAFSPDSTRVVVAGDGDFALRVWEVATGKLLLTLPGHRAQVVAVAYSPDGQRLASGSYDGQAKIWDAAQGDNLRTLAVSTGHVYSVAFAPDNKRLATASDRDGVRLWDLETGLPLFVFKGQPGRVFQIAFSTDGTRLAAADGEGSVVAWDATAATGAAFLSATGPVQALAVSADGKLLLSGSRDGPVQVWDTDTGAEVRKFGTPPVTRRALALHPNGHQVVTQGQPLSVEVWNPRDGTRRHTEKLSDFGIQAAASSPDGTCFATAGTTGLVRIWSATDFQQLRTFQGEGSGFGLAYDGKGTQLALRDGAGVKVWETATGRLTATFADPTLVGGPVAFSPDGQHLAIGNQLGVVVVWNLKTGQPVRRLTGHTGWVTGLAYSPDGKRLASCSEDKTVQVWNPLAGEPLLTLAGGLGSCHCVAFSPCGKYLFAGAESGVCRWAAPGEPVK